ncbi:hypothetical protein CFP65_6636 [Kitasatospora sp. MMS16-BH015]|uniref:hypothetical protein n=1 Tax=Kitasatospora sp. MMS16-BH015 TaxID=2018025 RepID=UPI000CA1EAE9|nr:hypothetical protein [Kitasatospora sp. MMS16-BH015]AUG81283.1 hypothetical protein CFP65_6636 [Kitasatospora sp. MMS16-BH015]
MAKVTVSLDADLAIDLMLLSGTKSPQDAVELLVHDYLARGRRTEARTAEAQQNRAPVDRRRLDPEG